MTLPSPIFRAQQVTFPALIQRDVRRKRQIREARESPQGFMDVLTVLCSDDDSVIAVLTKLDS